MSDISRRMGSGWVETTPKKLPVELTTQFARRKAGKGDSGQPVRQGLSKHQVNWARRLRDMGNTDEAIAISLNVSVETLHEFVGEPDDG